MRDRLLLAILALPLFLAVGLHAFWPMIQQEIERRKWWETVWSSSEDALAVFWYLRFVSSNLFRRSQSNIRQWSGIDGIASEWRRVALSMLIGAAIAICSEAWAFRAEKSGYQAATTTLAEGRCTNSKVFPDTKHFKIVCHFVDQLGIEHDFWVIAVDSPGHPPTGYSAELVIALRRGVKTFPIAIRYDPGHPQRAWIDGTCGIDENGIQWASIALLTFQMMGLLCFALIFLPRLHNEALRGVFPWWVDIYKIMPLAIKAVILGLAGVLEIAVGRML